MVVIQTLKRIFHTYDWALFASIVALICSGLITLLSIGHPGNSFFFRQLIWIVIAFLCLVIFSTLDYRLFRSHFAPVLAVYAFGVLATLAVFFIGTTVRGARSWIALGPFHLEPVEPLKVILVLILAKYFSLRHAEIHRFRHIVISGFYVFVPTILVLLQPDLGSFVVLVALWVGMLLVSGITLRHFTLLVCIGLLVSTLAWSFVMLDYQKARIITFLNPTSDPYGSGYNTIQSMVAVASGGLWGRGFEEGTQSQLGFLPEAHTDFIYAAIVEQFGAFFGVVLLCFYGLLFWRLMMISSRATDNFARLTALGFSLIILVHVIFNIGMTIGLLPVTGLPLPFVSYGGSSLVTLCIAIGITQSIYKRSFAAFDPEPEQVRFGALP